MRKRWLFWLALLALVFWLMVAQVEQGYETQGKQQLEDALRRTAVSCYASEGFYPPSVDYMRRHYGLAFDQERYLVRYEIFASNLMPDITVLEVSP